MSSSKDKKPKADAIVPKVDSLNQNSQWLKAEDCVPIYCIEASELENSFRYRAIKKVSKYLSKSNVSIGSKVYCPSDGVHYLSCGNALKFVDDCGKYFVSLGGAKRYFDKAKNAIECLKKIRNGETFAYLILSGDVAVKNGLCSQKQLQRLKTSKKYGNAEFFICTYNDSAFRQAD